MTTHYNIHSDFHSIKGMKTTVQRWPLALMNGFVSAVNALSLSKYKAIVTHEKITGADGHHIPLLIIKPEDLPASSPTLVYYHGGAFIFKHSPVHVDNAVHYARDAKC